MAPTLALTEKMAAGDERAFTELVERYSDQLTVFITRHASGAIGGDVDADDLFQTIVLRAWRLRETFVDRGPESFYRWLVQIGRNVIGDRVRYLGSKGRNSVSALASPEDGVPDTVTSVATRVYKRETFERFEDSLQHLSPRQREVVEMCFVEGFTLAEAASRLGVTRATAWDHLSKALVHVRRNVPA